MQMSHDLTLTLERTFKQYHTFYGFTGMITRMGRWENMRKGISFLSVLPTSQVGYHVGKPIESVIYCFYEITLSFL